MIKKLSYLIKDDNAASRAVNIALLHCSISDSKRQEVSKKEKGSADEL